ncbi:YdcF family protein [Parasphingorhabdus sp. DH2-15]|uniref:YdcF family protein n=1 Tax=Parasphingorhabdus sp. DH2-15 TaxID=3444112 RepID=UPI003F6888FE
MIVRLIAFLMLCWILGFAWFSIMLPQPLDTALQSSDDIRKTDAIVVLTGEGGRIEHGLEILQQDGAQTMLITGVDRQVKRDELAAQYPDQAEAFACCIDLGFAAVDTRTNALETARWVAKGEFETVRLITSNWHMRRAAFEMERALPQGVVTYRDAVVVNVSLKALFLEYNKYLLRLAGALSGI